MKEFEPTISGTILPQALAHAMHRKNYNLPGHAHELTFTCYQGFKFLEADRTRNWFVEAISAARNPLNFSVWAYVLMPEHVHLLIYPRDAVYDIAAIRKAIKAPIAKQSIDHIKRSSSAWLKKITRVRCGKTEHLFWQAGGGYDRNIDNPKTLLAAINYIHMNPVRRGLVDSPLDWKWSSARWFADRSEGPLALDQVPCEWLD